MCECDWCGFCPSRPFPTCLHVDIEICGRVEWSVVGVCVLYMHLQLQFFTPGSVLKIFPCQNTQKCLILCNNCTVFYYVEGPLGRELQRKLLPWMRCCLWSGCRTRWDKSWSHFESPPRILLSPQNKVMPWLEFERGVSGCPGCCVHPALCTYRTEVDSFPSLACVAFSVSKLWF